MLNFLIKNDRKSIIYRLLLGLIIFLIYSYSSKESNNLEIFTISDLCKATIATTMSKDPSIMTIDDNSNEIIYLSYIRDFDGKKWSYKCKVNGNKAIWATLEGRWRDDKADSKITYKEENNQLIVAEKYSDNNVITKKFTKSDFN
jgi:hypothetical protein